MENNTLQDSSVITVLLTSIIVVIILCVVVILFFYFSRSKVLKAQVATQNLKLEHQKQLLHETILTQEEERQRIAQDLHDDISAKLNVINLNLHLLKKQEIKSEDFNSITDTISQVTTQALLSSRKIAHDLLPPILEKFGLIPALDELCDGFNSSKSVAISKQVVTEIESIDKKNKLHLFRMFQELINNSVRHGHSSEIQFTITKNNHEFQIVYIDNGCGFNTEDIENLKGLGMKNIISRIELLKGQIQFKSAINEGVRVEILI